MRSATSCGIAAHLILAEHVVGQVDDLLHVDDGADAWDVYVSQHGEHQDGLHQQLPVLRLRDAVQNRLHVDGELYLFCCHLEQDEKGELWSKFVYMNKHV